MVASGTQNSAALDFGFELLNSGERFRAIMGLLFVIAVDIQYHAILEEGTLS